MQGMNEPNTSAPPSRRDRERARHRQEILDAAVRLFAEHGFYQTTMQMVAERAEFSVGYLYKHFAGKEEMYQEMVLYHSGRMAEMLDYREGDPASALEKIRHTLVQVAEHFNHHRDFMRIFHQEIGGCDELLETKKQHFEVLVQWLRQAQDEGEIRAYDPELLAAAIQGSIKELFGELADRSDTNPFDQLPDLVFQLLIDPLRI